MYVCMWDGNKFMYVCRVEFKFMYVGLTNIMFMPPGSLLVEIVGVFDGRMLPLCGNSSNNITYYHFIVILLHYEQ